MAGFRVFSSQLQAVLKDHVLADFVALRTSFDAATEIVTVSIQMGGGFGHTFFGGFAQA